MNKKNVCISIIIGLFLAFSTYCYLVKRTSAVVNIEANNEIELDSGERIKSEMDIISFKNKSLCEEISKSTGIDIEYILAIGYVADRFVENSLSGKKVVIRDNHILVDNFDYTDRMMSSGFVFKNNKPLNPQKFNEELQYVKKQNYRIYNVKSNKYHKLTCKYGQIAHDSVIMPLFQIPKNAKACKFCLVEKETEKDIIQTKKHQSIIPIPPLTFTHKYFKIMLNDYTNTLRPSSECRTSFCKEIVSEINNAQSTIDIAVYGYTRVPAFEFALINAINRGVMVRLVYDINSKGENIYPDTFNLVKLIPNSSCDKAPEGYSKSTEYTNSFMHNKFIIFDKKTVITGSANISANDMSGFNSNSVIKINSSTIANIFEQEFNQMYESKYHNLKTQILDKNDIILGDSKISIWFSPKDNTINKALVPVVSSAKKYIFIPSFLITNKTLATALIAAKHRGVDIKVIVDAVNARSTHSMHGLLREAGILVKTENYAGKLHSKSMIIDDEYVVIGSMNFSYSGNVKNDENLVVIKNRDLAIFYKNFFNYLWSKIDDKWLKYNVAPEGIDSIGSCSDGVDNDYDGKIDMADEGCHLNIK